MPQFRKTAIACQRRVTPVLGLRQAAQQPTACQFSQALRAHVDTFNAKAQGRARKSRQDIVRLRWVTIAVSLTPPHCHAEPLLIDADACRSLRALQAQVHQTPPSLSDTLTGCTWREARLQNHRSRPRPVKSSSTRIPTKPTMASRPFQICPGSTLGIRLAHNVRNL